MIQTPLRVVTVSFLALAMLTAPPTQADSKGRGAVKDFSFEFEPSSPSGQGIPMLRVCILPLINSNDLDHHTKNLKKALRNIEGDEVPRVLGIRYNAYGKPLNRFLVPDPFEVTIAAAIEAELVALGMEVLPSSGMNPPSNLRERTLAAIAEAIPADVRPDLLIAAEIEDFFFETRPGFAKLKMETFFTLDVAVFDVSAGEILWDGLVEAGDLSKKGVYMGKEAVETRLDAAFQDLIESVVRNNEELRAALSEREGKLE